MSESLRSLSDQEVISRTELLVLQERRVTLKLLVHLREIERRQLYLKQGYGSLFEYCTTGLRFSEPAAARRIRTARSLSRFPQLHAMLETGDVTLTTVSMVAKFLKPENADIILARIKGKSRQGVERIIAEYDPRVALPPDRVRTIVVPVPATPAADPTRGTVAGDSEKSPILPPSSDEPGAPVVQQTPRFETHALVQFAAHQHLMVKLERIRSIAAHRLPPGASLEQLLGFMSDYILEREDPAEREKRRAARQGQKKAATTFSNPGERRANLRAIPARVRDQVFLRDRGRCTYVSATGRRCDSKHMLQLDHIVPVARGGASTAENLRLLCAYHNRLEAERLMGRSGPPEKVSEGSQPTGALLQ